MTLINEKFLFKNQNSSDVALIAQRLSKVLEIGDILLLKGPVGAGKSFFARCIINEFFKIFKIYEDIPSPSFSLIQTYDNIKPKFCHVDLLLLEVLNKQVLKLQFFPSRLLLLHATNLLFQHFENKIYLS